MCNIEKIENLEDLIKGVIEGQVIEQKVSSLLPQGENYASVLYRVDFKIKKDGKVQEIHAVAKCPPPDPQVQEVSKTPMTFKLEIAWYNTVIPTMIQFQKDRGIKKAMDFFQRVYGSRINLDSASDKFDFNAVILSENLKYLGYTNVDRNLGFDLPASHIILANLATFHAVPMAIRHHEPNIFNTKILPYLQTWASSKEIEIEFCKFIFEVYSHIPEFQTLMGRIRKTINESNVFQKRIVREPWATAVHMDFWSNNIMLTQEENPKIIILDLQCPGFASPVADVALFLLTAVNHDIILENFDNLLKFYYDEFIKNLKELHVPIEKFSFDSFHSEFNTEVKIGEFAHALSHIAIVFSDNDIINITDGSNSFINNEISVNEKQIKKFKWITSEAIQRNWI